VGKSRIASINNASNNGADLVILDDGLQDSSIESDLNILVFSGFQGIGNGRIIPSGPMREYLSKAVDKSDLAIIIEEDKNNIKELIIKNIPVVNANLKIADKDLNNFKKKKVMAFCGIGYPEKFYKTLEKIECEIMQTKSYPDHYAYSKKDIEYLLNQSQNINALLVTTEKDYVKIPKEYKNRIYFFPISIEFNDYSIIDKFLLSIMKS